MYHNDKMSYMGMKLISNQINCHWFIYQSTSVTHLLVFVLFTVVHHLVLVALSNSVFSNFGTTFHTLSTPGQ